MFQPLSFSLLEPAVQALFCLRASPWIYPLIMFSPWFLQKTPRNSVFLTVKPLDLVLSLDFVFQLRFRRSLCPHDRCNAQNSSRIVLFAVFMYCLTISQCQPLFACMFMLLPCSWPCVREQTLSYRRSTSTSTKSHLLSSLSSKNSLRKAGIT